jgi:hypothetical protein
VGARTPAVRVQGGPLRASQLSGFGLAMRVRRVRNVGWERAVLARAFKPDGNAEIEAQSRDACRHMLAGRRDERTLLRGAGTEMDPKVDPCGCCGD